MTHSRKDITELLDRYELRPSRALGQNFVADANTVRRIVALAGLQPGQPVVEIGAGLGSLSLALLEADVQLTCVELDKYLVPVLREFVEPKGARVVEADAMTLDWDALLADHDDWFLVANLPYNIATPLVADLLDGVPAIKHMLVMVQKEVGERLVAAPATDPYGAVSVKVAYWATGKVVGKVPASVFVPPPKIESALVRIDRRDSPAVDASVVSSERLFTVVRATFAHRRKMLRRSLDGVVAPEAYEKAGIRPEARPEELSVEEFGRLAAL